jgi:hypothetical protein
MDEPGGRNANEDAALAWVMQWERSAGRVPRAVLTDPTIPADIESPPRLIAVQAFAKSARSHNLVLDDSQFAEAKRNPEFFIYVVENTASQRFELFGLKVLTGKRLLRLLEGAFQINYLAIPWPESDYDTSSDSPTQSELTGDTELPARSSRGPDLEVFEDDDQNYLDWLRAHYNGYVLDVPRSAHVDAPKVHRAHCPIVWGEQPRERNWTGTYTKICSYSYARLSRWASEELDTEPSPCRICM